MAGEPTKVYPIPGRFIVGVPLVEHEVPTKAEAESLVATGAFALSEKEANEQAFTTPEGKPASTDNVKQPSAPPAPAPVEAGDETPAKAPAKEKG